MFSTKNMIISPRLSDPGGLTINYIMKIKINSYKPFCHTVLCRRRKVPTVPFP